MRITRSQLKKMIIQEFLYQEMQSDYSTAESYIEALDDAMQALSLAREAAYSDTMAMALEGHGEVIDTALESLARLRDDI